jgi:AhpC/TSA family
MTKRPPGDSGPLDFGPDHAAEEAQRWAQRRDPDLEAPTQAAPGDQVPPPPRPRGPYAWLFGVIVAAILIYIGLNTLRNVGSISRGVEPGRPLPQFAAPLALSRLEGDANVATRRGQGQSGTRPACEVRGPDILNSCQLTQGAPAVLAFVATADPLCAAQLDGFERVWPRFRGVRFAAVAARTDRNELRRLIRRRGWRFPVAFDRDGAVFALYGVVDCPTVTFAYPGGIAMRTTLRPLDDRRLAATVRALVEASKQRGWRAPTPG